MNLSRDYKAVRPEVLPEVRNLLRRKFKGIGTIEELYKELAKIATPIEMNCIEEEENKRGIYFTWPDIITDKRRPFIVFLYVREKKYTISCNDNGQVEIKKVD